MNYVEYDSPIGKIYIQSDGDFLTGLWLEHQKYFPKQVGVFKEDAVLLQAKKWVDIDFRGENPKISLLPPHLPSCLTRQWSSLLRNTLELRMPFL